MRMHLVEVLEGRWQLRQYRLRVTQVHARLKVLTKLLAMPLLCGLQTGVLMGFRPARMPVLSFRRRCRRRRCH